MKIGEKTTFSTAYLLSILPLIIFTAILVSPKVMITLIWATLGVGALLGFLPTLTAYMLCFIPAAFAVNGRRWPFVAISLVAFAMATLMPHFMGQREANTIIGEQSREARMSQTRARSLHIEIDTGYSGAFEIPASSCGAECNLLLKSGQLDWVRIDLQSGSEKKRFIYKAEQGEACSSPGFPASTETRCVFSVPLFDGQADYRLRMTADQPRDQANVDGWTNVKQRVTVAGFERNSQTPSYFQRQLDLAIPVMPMILVAHVIGAHDSRGVELWRSVTRDKPINFKQVFTDLGYKITDSELAAEKSSTEKRWQNGLTPDLNRQLLAVLDAPQSTAFDASQAGIIDLWTTHARAHKAWNSQLISLAERIVKDERLQGYTNIDQVFDASEDVSRALIPAVLDRLKRAPDSKSFSDLTGIVRWGFTSIRPELLYPHAERIVKLATKPGHTREWFYPAMGRIGQNPLPFLLPFNAPSALDQPLLRVIGACHAETKWSAVLVPELKQALAATGTFQEGTNQSSYQAMLMSALVAHGETDYVLRLLPADSRRARLIRSATAHLKRYGKPDCRDF